MSTLVFATDPQNSSIDATDASTTQTTTETTPAIDSSTEPMATETITQPASATTEQAGFSRGSVVRSIFTSAIQDREPIDKLNNAASDTEQVFYFTELRDMSGQTATHRWEHDGKVIAEVKFDVRGPRWRVWSSKSFVPSTAGDWKVSVVNGAGETISEELISLSEISDQNSSSSLPATDTTGAATEPGAAAETGISNESPSAPAGSVAE